MKICSVCFNFNVGKSEARNNQFLWMFAFLSIICYKTIFVQNNSYVFVLKGYQKSSRYDNQDNQVSEIT